MKKFWALLLITAVFIVSGCGSTGNGKTVDGKITVAASFTQWQNLPAQSAAAMRKFTQ